MLYSTCRSCASSEDVFCEDFIFLSEFSSAISQRVWRAREEEEEREEGEDKLEGKEKKRKEKKRKGKSTEKKKDLTRKELL